MMMDVCMHDANIIITSNFVYIELFPTIMCFTERLFFFKIQEIVKNAANTDYEIFMKAS